MSFNMNIAIICGVSLAAFLFLGVFILIFAKMIKNGRPKQKSKNKNQGPDEEALLIQEIYQGLSRMEQRVEALETILFEPKKEKNPDD